MVARSSAFETGEAGGSKVVGGGGAGWGDMDEKAGFPVAGKKEREREMGVGNDLPSYGQVMKGED